MWAVVRVYVQNDYSASAVESDFVDVGEDRRLNVIGADVAQLRFNVFRIVHAFDAQLIVDSEDYRAARGVGQRDDLGGQLFDVTEADLQFEVGVFAATHH